MCRLTIQVKDVKGDVPSWMLAQDGGLYFDYEGSTSIIRQVQEVGDKTGKIKKSAARQVTFDITRKNTFIRNTQTRYNRVNVIVKIDGISIEENVLIFKGIDRNKQKWEFTSSIAWIDAAANALLVDLVEFDFYEHYMQNVWDSWDNDYKYTGVEKGCWFPTAYYGGLVDLNEDDNNYTLRSFDYRAWFSPSKILEDSFCKLGFKLDTSFLTSLYSGRESCYILGDSCSTVAELNKPERWYAGFSFDIDRVIGLKGNSNYDVKVYNTADQTIDPTIPEIIDFQDSSVLGYDATDLYDGFWQLHPTTNKHGLHNTKGVWVASINLYIYSEVEEQVEFEISGLNKYLVEWINFNTIPLPTNWIVSEKKIIDLKKGEHVYTFQIRFTAMFDEFSSPSSFSYSSAAYSLLLTRRSSQGEITIRANSSIHFSAETVFPFPFSAYNPDADISGGSLIHPSSWIHADLTLLDFFAGILHLSNSIVSTNTALSALSIYPKYATFFDHPFNPIQYYSYYISTKEYDLRDFQICNSLRYGIEEAKQYSQYFLGFKKEKCNWAKSQGQDFFSSRNDISAITGETEGAFENRNPLFEPVIDRHFVEIKPVGDTRTVSVATLWDNESHEPSTDLGFRIAIGYGRVEQLDNNGVLLNTTHGSEIGYVSQNPTGRLSPETQLVTSPSYGQSERNDTLLSFYQNDISNPNQFKIYMFDIVCKNYYYFLLIDERSPLLFYDEFGQTRRGKLVKKTYNSDSSIANIEVVIFDNCSPSFVFSEKTGGGGGGDGW